MILNRVTAAVETRLVDIVEALVKWRALSAVASGLAALTVVRKHRPQKNKTKVTTRYPMRGRK